MLTLPTNKGVYQLTRNSFFKTRATNSLHNDTRITVRLHDQNDEIPMFTGLNENGRYRSSIAENSPVGTSVIRVSASDRDKNPQFSKVPPRTPVIHDVVMCDSCFCRQVSYHLKPTYDWEFFTIHHESGLISSAHVFDREVKSEYYVIVVAEDGAPSDRPNHFPRETPNRGQHAHHLSP